MAPWLGKFLTDAATDMLPVYLLRVLRVGPSSLVTNDDAVHSLGIPVLADALKWLGDVMIAAPRFRKASTIGHALTLRRPLRDVPSSIGRVVASLIITHRQVVLEGELQRHQRRSFGSSLPDAAIARCLFAVDIDTIPRRMASANIPARSFTSSFE